MKEGYVFSVIGRVQSGKTPIIKIIIEKSEFKNVIIYDSHGDEYDKEKYTIFYNIEIFRNYVMDKKFCFIVYEEATTFLSNYKDLEIQKICTDIAHNNNVGCFVFHSMTDAPKSVLNKSRYIILLPTLDDEKDVKNMRNRYYESFLEVRETKLPVVIDNYKI